MAATTFSRRIIARVIAGKLVSEPSRQDFWIQTLAAYLVDQKRAGEAGLIMNDIAHELLEQNGQLLTHVTSARALTDDVRKALKRLLSERTNAKEVVITEEVDPSLLGGLVARTADAELDTSVRTTLNRLRTIN